MTSEAPAEFTEVKAEWIDLYGHMNMAYYVQILDELGHRILERYDLGSTYTRTENRGLFTVDANIQYHQEVRLGDRLRVNLSVLGYDSKRLRTCVTLHNVDKGYLSATLTQTALNVDLETRRVALFSPLAQASLEKLWCQLGAAVIQETLTG